MREPISISSPFGLAVYPYAALLAAGLLLAFALFLVLAKRSGLTEQAAYWFLPAATLLGLLGARVFYFLVRIEPLLLDFGPGFFFSFRQGGFALMGAMLGIGLAAFWVGRRTRQTALLLDVAAPCGALLLTVGRFAEALTLEGLGSMVENPTFHRFPFAVRHAFYEEWYLPVFFYEGLFALLLSVLLSCRLLRKKGGRAGEGALLFLLLFGTGQIFLESLRQDEYLRWGFVRVNQLCCAALVLGVAALWGLRAWRAKKRRPWWVALVWGLLLLGVGGLVAIEFALDKSSVPNVWLHAIMAAVLLAMAALTLSLRGASPNRGKDALPTP